MKNVLFMDIINVVNTQKVWMQDRYGKPVLKTFKHPKIEGRFNNLQAIQWISEFCEKHNFEIVITSMLHMIFEWKPSFRSRIEDVMGVDRNLNEWKKIFMDSGLREDVKISGRLDPDDMFSSIDREESIMNFINKNKVDNFILITNQPFYKKRLNNRTILCPESGFLEPQFKEAEKILKGA